MFAQNKRCSTGKRQAVCIPLNHECINETPHDKTNKIASAPSKDPDQPVHLSDLSLLYAQWVAKNPSFLHADSEGPDQTKRMPRLI